jgi:hypothetical protein
MRELIGDSSAGCLLLSRYPAFMHESCSVFIYLYIILKAIKVIAMIVQQVLTNNKGIIDLSWNSGSAEQLLSVPTSQP